MCLVFRYSFTPRTLYGASSASSAISNFQLLQCRKHLTPHELLQCAAQNEIYFSAVPYKPAQASYSRFSSGAYASTSDVPVPLIGHFMPQRAYHQLILPSASIGIFSPRYRHGCSISCHPFRRRPTDASLRRIFRARLLPWPWQRVSPGISRMRFINVKQ